MKRSRDDPAINVQNVAVQKAPRLPQKARRDPADDPVRDRSPGTSAGALLPVRVATAGLDDNYLIESVNMRDVQGRGQPISR